MPLPLMDAKIVDFVGYGTEGYTLSREEMQASQENNGNLGPIMRLMKGSEVRPLRWTVSPYNEAYWITMRSDDKGCCSDNGRPSGDRIV